MEAEGGLVTKRSSYLNIICISCLRNTQIVAARFSAYCGSCDYVPLVSINGWECQIDIVSAHQWVFSGYCEQDGLGAIQIRLSWHYHLRS